MMFRVAQIPIALVLLISLSGCPRQTAELRPTLAGLDEGAFGFESHETLHWDNILKARFEGVGKTVAEAEIILPEASEGSVPAVVLMHGSGGRGKREKRYAAELIDEGFAVVILDSFGPRGIRTTGGRQEQVSTATMLGDVFAVLDLLDSHPKIDGSRVAIVGFSKGGSVAMLSADEKIRRGLLQTDRRFAAHVAFYPGCVIKLKEVEPTGSPLLVLLGGSDSYTPAEQCERFMSRMRAADYPVRSITYPGAHHAWDGDYQVRKSNFDYSYGNCEAEIDAAGRTLDGKTGEVVDARSKSAVRKWIRGCGVPGVWIGLNQAAKDKSLADMKAFLRKTLLK